REWDPARGQYTGFRLTARVTHLVRGPELEVPAGVVVLSIEVLGARVEDSGGRPEGSPTPGSHPPHPRPSDDFASGSPWHAGERGAADNRGHPGRCGHRDRLREGMGPGRIAARPGPGPRPRAAAGDPPARGRDIRAGGPGARPDRDP